MTTTERVLFVGLVNEGTGIPRLVLHAWVLAEGGPASNPLNIGPGRNYGNVNGAAKATIELLKTSRYAPILRAARTGNDADVIAAIVASPWDAGHYKGAGGKVRGQLLRGTYRRVSKDDDPGLFKTDDILGDAASGVAGAITDPIERAAASVETFLVDKSKLALAYVGLTTASLLLFVAGLSLATGAHEVGLGLLRSRAGGKARAGSQTDEIPF